MEAKYKLPKRIRLISLRRWKSVEGRTVRRFERGDDLLYVEVRDEHLGRQAREVRFDQRQSSG
jgi:hypothetical protein